ncbi:hypothetical protein [Paenibacillus hamazuiensis]|uniref:hypothetical protein n=1 Tax=Paenibacillus hamazuiensis TaxID=2936508 RepID=UPI00200F00C6|nr:hypothetical protein [Paenibacillus hamazuiensis]
MNRRLPAYAYVIFGLVAVGILARFVSDPRGMIVPIVVFGVVFLLYKFPPSRWQRRKTAPGPRFAKPKEKRRAPFRVIQGNKPDDDDLPKYH